MVVIIVFVSVTAIGKMPTHHKSSCHLRFSMINPIFIRKHNQIGSKYVYERVLCKLQGPAIHHPTSGLFDIRISLSSPGNLVEKTELSN